LASLMNRTDALGEIRLHRAGKMHHLGTGATNARRRVLAISDQTTVTVIDLTTAEVLSTHTIDPTAATGATNKKSPGRGPGP